MTTTTTTMERRKKINFRPKKFNRKNLEFINLFTQRRMIEHTQYLYYYDYYKLCIITSTIMIELCACEWDLQEMKNTRKKKHRINKSDERAKIKSPSPVAKRKKTKGETHNSNYQIKSGNLDVLCWCLFVCVAKVLNEKRHNRTLFTALIKDIHRCVW